MNDNANILFNPVLFQVAFLNQIPHKKQIEVLNHAAKNKLISCGRRSGKTQMIAGELIRGAISGAFKKQFVITPSYKQSKIVFTKILELTRDSPLVQQYLEGVSQSPYPQIRFYNEFSRNLCVIDFGSADNPTTIRGESYSRIFIDEAAFIKEDARIALKPLIYDTGGPIWQTSTPYGKNEFYEDCFRAMKDGVENAFFHYNYRDNPYLHEEGVKEIEKEIEAFGINSVRVQQEILGNFVEDADAYFPQELIDDAVLEYPMISPSRLVI